MSGMFILQSFYQAIVSKLVGLLSIPLVKKQTLNTSKVFILTKDKSAVLR